MATETFILEIKTRGTKKSAANVKRIGTQANQVRKTLAFLRNALVAVAAIRVFASLTASLVEFSDQMLVVKAVTGATTLEFERMREVAKGLGATTRFTAGEAAEGMAFLARAGFDVNEVMTAIPGVLDLAAAAQLDLGNAADIASNLMTSFGLSVSDIPEIMDTLVFTANNANTTVQQLADGMKLFAPIASQLGISLKDAASFMAILGDAGIQASLAGTGLRRIITDLEAPTGTLAKVLKKLGIGFDEVRPSVVGLEGALQVLADAGIGASIASALFGKRGGFIAAQLLATIDASGEFRDLLEEIEGAAKKAAEEMEAGLGGALRLVRSALQNLIISFGDLGGEEFLNQFFRDLAEGLRLIATNAEQVFKAMKLLLVAFLSVKVLAFGVGLTVVTVNLARYTLGTIAAAFSTETLGSRIKLLGLALLKIPFVAILTALTLLGAGFVAFGDQIKVAGSEQEKLSDVFDELVFQMDGAVTDIVNALGGDFEDFGAIISQVASDAAKGIKVLVAIFAGLRAAVGFVFDKIEVLLKEFLINIADTILTFRKGVNSVLDFFGVGNAFDNTIAEKNITALNAEIDTLNESLDKGGTLFERFNRAGLESLDNIAGRAQGRIAGDLDAAIIATESANRSAAKARAEAAKIKAVTGGGITLESVLGDDDATSAQKAFDSLRASLDPLVDGMTRFKEGTEAAVAEVKAGNLEWSEFDELMNLLARDIVGLSNAEFELIQRQKLVNELIGVTGLKAEEAALALRQFDIAAQGAFVSALNGASPLLAINQKLSEIQLFIDENQKNIAASGLSVADVQQRMAREAFGLSQTYEQVNEEIQALIQNQDLLGLSTADLEHEIRKLDIAFLEGQRDAASGAQRAFLKLQDDATNAAAQTEKAFTDAFKAIEDAVVDFAQTGTFSVNDFFRNFAEQLLRLGTQQAIAGIGAGFSNAFGSGTTGFGGPSVGGGNIGGIIAGALFGGKHGGNFTVGANTAVQSLPGIDNRLIAFKARDNEHVTITPKNQGPGAVGGPMNIVFNVETKDADSFVRSQSQLQNRLLAATSQARRRR